ncbi:exosortase/archaeosortase family protein [Bailinhaonella thermotolerans]|uniref:Uncharacterized protein n=1 Tax=Bailinhaonella thermotolerans TaxID=1070861 RepID=A0A3A4B4A4_9ACTN|nr:exosortase/archaeosortase family protein [Bailinhaonella thermotolerans]RJL33147.1 hypothetical protein D5H75_09865 [Bailinhaonella thermotolerans]
MSEQADQLVLAYVSRVADAAHGMLRPHERLDFVRRLRLRIDEMRDGSDDPAVVRKVLARFGDPAALVAREADRLAAEAHGAGAGDPRTPESEFIDPRSESPTEILPAIREPPPGPAASTGEPRDGPGPGGPGPGGPGMGGTGTGGTGTGGAGGRRAARPGGSGLWKPGRKRDAGAARDGAARNGTAGNPGGRPRDGRGERDERNAQRGQQGRNGRNGRNGLDRNGRARPRLPGMGLPGTGVPGVFRKPQLGPQPPGVAESLKAARDALLNKPPPQPPPKVKREAEPGPVQPPGGIPEYVPAEDDADSPYVRREKAPRGAGVVALLAGNRLEAVALALLLAAAVCAPLALPNLAIFPVALIVWAGAAVAILFSTRWTFRDRMTGLMSPVWIYAAGVLVVWVNRGGLAAGLDGFRLAYTRAGPAMFAVGCLVAVAYLLWRLARPRPPRRTRSAG